MNHKYLIIGVSVLLIVALVFGFVTLSDSFNFVSNKIEKIGSLGNTILKISGMDFNTAVDLFVPSYKEAVKGSYVDSNGQLQSIEYAINSILPNWIYEQQNTNIELYLYPTFYSADFGSQLTKWQPDYSFSPDVTDIGIFQRRIVLSSNRILRFKLNVWTLKSGTLSYDFYVFYDKIDKKYCYFVTFENSDIGYYSNYLNNFEQFSNELDLDKKLNSTYIQVLTNSNLATIHNYDFISNLQNTDVYIQYSFDEFVN